MDLKIKVKCHACKCSFEFRQTNSNNREYACPNCRSVIEKEIAEHITNGICELYQVPDRHPENSQFPDSDDGFSFSIVLPDGFDEFGTFS